MSASRRWFSRSSRGATMLEFSLSSILFLAVLTIGADLLIETTRYVQFCVALQQVAYRAGLGYYAAHAAPAAALTADDSEYGLMKIDLAARLHISPAKLSLALCPSTQTTCPDNSVSAI